MSGRYIVNTTAGKRVIILEEDDEKIEGGYFDPEGVWHELSRPLDGDIIGKYVINETGGNRIILLQEDAEDIGGGYFDEEGTWYDFGKKWDVDWNYSMGLPEDNGITVDKTGTTFEELTDSGLKIHTNNGNHSVIFRLGESPYKFRKAVLEVTFETYINMNNSSLLNLLFILGNDSNGVSILDTRNSFRLRNNSVIDSCTPVHSSVNNKEYKFRLILNLDKFELFLDNEKIYEGDASEMLYATSCQIWIGNVSGSYYVNLKDIKFKANATEV